MDNVLVAVQGVNWRTLGKALLPYDGTFTYPKLDEIERQQQSDDDRLHAVVTTWVQGSGMDKEPSWRWLIWRLPNHNLSGGVTDNVLQFAEPVLGTRNYGICVGNS